MTDQNEIFINLITAYRLGLFRLANGILKNTYDAEDAVSEATCKAYANFHKLRDINKFKPWIMKILVNEAYNIANKRKKYSPLEEDILVEDKNSEILDAIVLWDKVQILKDELRAVTILFYYEDMSIKEISNILKIPIGTVNSRLNRSRRCGAGMNQYYAVLDFNVPITVEDVESISLFGVEYAIE